MLMQSLRCYASLWPPHVYPWKGIPLEGVWREGKRGRDVLGYPYTLAPRYLLKETLVTVGYPLPHWAHSDGPGFPWAGRAWISIAQWAHPLPDGPGFPWGKWTHPRAWFSMGPWMGPLEQWAHPLNSCSTRLIVDRPIVTMGNPLYKGPESPRVSLTRIGI